MRRKLATWIDERGNRRYGVNIQPFWLESGTYGYRSYDPKNEKKLINETIESFGDLTILLTAVLSVDTTDALIVLPTGIFVDFFLNPGDAWFKFERHTHGVSGVSYFLAGYLAYQVIFNRAARNYLPILATGESLFGAFKNLQNAETNQYAHFGGYMYGFLFASGLNLLKNSTNGVDVIRRHDTVLTGMAMIWFLVEWFDVLDNL